MPVISISINARQRCIIYALLKSETHLTLEALSKQTGLTSRIIRYNLDTVKTWFRHENIKLNSRPGVGIEIEANRLTRKRLMALISSFDENNLILTRTQRQRISLFELLTSQSPLTYHHLATNQGISRSTIVHDIKEMQCWLNSYGITLRRYPNKGTYLEGSEAARRFALLNVIHEELGEKKWYSLWYQPDLSSIFDKSLPLNLEEYLEMLNLDFARNAIIHIENLMGYRMALYSRVEIMVFLAVSIDAMIKKQYLEIANDVIHEKHLEMEIAQAILTDINRKFDIKITQSEVSVLAACILGAKWEETRAKLSTRIQKFDFEQNYRTSLRFAESIVSICARQIHPLLLVDSELLAELTNHLGPVLYRLRYQLPILNDCMEKILNDYPEVFHASSLSVTEIESEIGINFPPEEIAYIAMYIVAAMNRLKTSERDKYQILILGDGIRAKTSLLKSRIEYEFPQLEIIGISNGYIHDDSNFENVELVVSILSGEMSNKPTIQISPFLTTGEKKLIQSWINEKEEKARKLTAVPHHKPDLVDLLLPRNIVFSVGEQNWRDAVKKASQPLLEFESISQRYVNAMIQVIEEHGPYMLLAPGVIILHARPADGVNDLCLSMLVLDKSIRFSDSVNEMIDIAFVLGAIDEHSHVNALLQLSTLVGQAESCKAIRQASKPSDVLRIIWGHSIQLVED